MAGQYQNPLLPGGLKPFALALIIYIAFVQLAYLVAIGVPGRKDFPFWAYVSVMHALMCAVVAGASKALVSVLEHWATRSSLRPYTGHIRNFMSALAVWPLIVAVAMIIWRWRHG